MRRFYEIYVILMQFYENYAYFTRFRHIFISNMPKLLKITQTTTQFLTNIFIPGMIQRHCGFRHIMPRKVILEI